MEGKEGLNATGVTVRRDEAPQSFRVEPRAENSVHFGVSAAPPAPASVAAPASDMKKKRGRPRKYATDGAIVALSPMPISSSIPLTSDYTPWKHNSGGPVDSLKKKHKLEFGKGRSVVPGGGNFIPHMLTVNTGEDINMKIISFSQQGSRAICILAANGSISNVTLRQPNSSGGTLTYEGRFEILSLTGSFMPNDNGVTKSRTGGMSVSLAGADGRVLGGGLAGMLVAAGPVQVVIGSFVPAIEHEVKPKKAKYEHTIAFGAVPSNSISEKRYEAAPRPPPQLNPTLTTSASFHGDNLASINTSHGSKTTVVQNNTSILFPAGDNSNGPNHEITC